MRTTIIMFQYKYFFHLIKCSYYFLPENYCSLKIISNFLWKFYFSCYYFPIQSAPCFLVHLMQMLIRAVCLTFWDHPKLSIYLDLKAYYQLIIIICFSCYFLGTSDSDTICECHRGFFLQEDQNKCLPCSRWRNIIYLVIHVGIIPGLGVTVGLVSALPADSSSCFHANFPWKLLWVSTYQSAC